MLPSNAFMDEIGVGDIIGQMRREGSGAIAPGPGSSRGSGKIWTCPGKYVTENLCMYFHFHNTF